MNREWRAKRNRRTTTPLPIEKKFFRFRSNDAKKESEKKESFNETSFKGIFGENDDPYRYTSKESDSSDEETTTNWDSWATDYSEETLSGSQTTEFSSPEITRCEGYREISPTAFLSEESLKCHCGNPKFTSTRNQSTGDDIQVSGNSLPSTILEMPLRINENDIKSPEWEEFENEVIREREIPLESPSALSFVPHVCTEDLRQVSRLSKEKENLDISRNSLRFMKNSFQLQDLQDMYSSITAITTEDIVDDVFKNSNDTISLKLDDAVLTNPDISLEQQEAEERSMHELPKRSIVTEKMKLKKKRHLGTERSYRKKVQVSNLKNSNEKTRLKALNSAKLSQSTKNVSKRASFWIDKEKYLQSVPVCVLSLPKTPYADIERQECSEEEARLIETRTSKRRKNISKTSKEKKFCEYEKYLKSVSICPLSLTKLPFSPSRRLEI